MIPWQKAEGLYATNMLGRFLIKLGLPCKVRFMTKEDLRQKSGMPDDVFEKDWAVLKENGIVKQVLVKYDNEGNIISLYEDGRVIGG